ncbi:hypothetical protein HMPREF0063_12974, partial [Aeromicrobium marinum DSM 15272]
PPRDAPDEVTSNEERSDEKRPGTELCGVHGGSASASEHERLALPWVECQ